MAEFLIFLLAWAFITAVGHGTWLVIRAAIMWWHSTDEGWQRKSQGADSGSESAPSPIRDMAAFERMVDALSATHAIAPQTAGELKQKARSFAEIQASQRAVRFDRDAIIEPDKTDGDSASLGSATHPVTARRSEQAGEQRPVQVAGGASTSVSPPFVAPSASRWQATQPSQPFQTQPEPSQPVSAKRALSEVIASFLAAHNIRWGELVAGLLIVICSIGLVVSLWSTITSSHRVVPSLIFMSADAAIFAAGLYTMRRWKMRHTSRAVLIIATLLVPLCVLAGLAAAGASVQSVSMGSPVTLAAIGIGTFFCGWLLWQASLVLVGRGRSVALTISVVVPTLCLPLLPAVARMLGTYAGSFLLVPAMATAIGLVMPVRKHLHQGAGSDSRVRRVGRRFWKNHWLHLGVAMASLASVVVYAAFLFQADGRAAWIQLAIATIPAWISVAMIHAAQVRSLSSQTTRATPRFVCSVLAVIAVGCVVAILPASIEQVRWLWAHGITVAGSIVLVSWLLRGRLRLVEASFPLGIAAMLSSPAWLAGRNWGDIEVWRTFFGGEPMIVAIGLVAVSAMAWAVWRQSNASKLESGAGNTLALVTTFWGVIAGVQAIVLSVAPPSWLGMMPVWGLAGALFAMMWFFAAASPVKPILARASTLVTVGFWITGFGLVKWYGSVLTLDYDSTPLVLLSVAVTTLIFATGVKFFGVKSSGLGNADAAALKFAESAAAFSSGTVGMLAVLASIGRHVETVSVPGWGTSAWMIGAASSVLAMAGILVRNRRYLQLAMLVSATGAFCGVTWYSGIEIWHTSAWKNADALWNVAGVLAVAAIGWQIIREGYRMVAMRRGGLILVDATWSRWRMPDGGMLLVSVVLLFGAVGWQYLAVLIAPVGEPVNQWFVLESRSGTQTLGRFVLLGCLAGGVWLCRYREPRRMFTQMLAAVGAMTGLLLAMAVSERFTELASTRLIITTTLACVGVAMTWWVSQQVRRHGVSRQDMVPFESSLGAGMIAVLISLGSAALLWSNWWLPLSESMTPDRLSTLAVATWWVVISLGLLTRNDGNAEALSALLLPASIIISVPVLYPSPAVVWWQASVLGSVLWLAMAWLFSWWSGEFSDRHGDAEQLTGRRAENQGILLSHVWMAAVGFGSAAMVLWGLVFAASWTASWSLPVGGIASLLAIVSVCLLASASRLWILRVLPFVPAVMSGHAAVFSVAMGWIGSSNAILVIMSCGLLASIGSAIWVWMRSEQVQAWHVSVQSIVLFALTILDGHRHSDLLLQSDGWVEWISLAGLASGAVALMRFVPADHSLPKGQPILSLPRVLGWFVIVAGVYLLLDHPHLPSSWKSMVTPTLVMAWIGACVVLWRSDRLTYRGDSDVTRADIAASALLLPMLLIGCGILLLDNSWQGPGRLTTAVVLGVSQAVIVLVVAASAWLRPSVVPGGPFSMWTISMGLIAGGAAVGALSLARAFGIETDPSCVILILAAMGALSVTVGFLPWLEQGRSKLAGKVGDGPQVDCLGIAVERVVIAWVAIGSLISFGLVVSSADANWVRLSILGSAIAAWTLFQLSEQTRPMNSAAATRRRHECVSVGLWTLALVAMLGEPSAILYLLTATMRVLIASVLAIGVLLLAVPRLLGGPFLDRWKHAFRRGGFLSAYVAITSLVLMLGLEVYYRQSDIGIPQLAMPLIVVVAFILGGFALMAGAIAILSGPGFESRFGFNGRLNSDTSRVDTESSLNWLRIDDTHRRWLLYVAQGIAGLTWLHLFLCRSGIAFAGLRQFWPYIVMLIAFASVGLTQWAVRRKDTVLSETMQKTAMFLPLIPIVGFWLSGSYATMFHSQDWSWTFYHGTTSYAGLLVVGAIYYGVMSVLWKRGFPRIATVVLGNGALWVLLTQMPGWDFLTHPQAWLIPPAMCVLAVAFWQRDLLDKTTGAAIRYAATLVIYISSTADMLMGEIGSSLWGPIVLIALSLSGMLAGVVLQIKPFLYLGTIFVFLGVTSMVWHAGQAIDAVWPWWVFGITSGLILLSALAGIEKHRDKLQRWSTELSRWEN